MNPSNTIKPSCFNTHLVATWGLNILPSSALVTSNILSKIWLFLFVAGKLKSFEYDLTCSATFLNSSILKVKGISSSSYRSQITCPSTRSV